MARNASTHTRAANPAHPDAGRQEVQQFLDRFAEALTSGDVDTLVSLWQVPACVVDQTGVKVVTSNEEIEQFFAGAKKTYNDQGITDTRAEIGELRWANARIAIVEVRWPYLDAQGQEVGDETSTYTLRRDEDDELRLRVTVMHGASKRVGKPQH